MEIRNALQKIENYLTVVSNLNKTILSEGTMSRDELLLMKKYLYTSIDRIEDIERSLIIDKRVDKVFTPAQSVENKFTPRKEKEIVEVAENDHIEEVENALATEQKDEMEDMVEEIHAESEKEEMVFVGEINPITEEEIESSQKVEIAPIIESIITEDYSLNKVENVSEEITSISNENTESLVEKVSSVVNIITEDYSVNKLVESKVAELIENVAETKSFAESIITEDYSLNKLYQTKEETVIENKAELVIEDVHEVESIITEDYSLNKLDDLSADNKEQVSLIEETIVAKENKETTKEEEFFSAQLEEKKATTFAEELANKKKEETALFEQLEKQLTSSSQSQLFKMFDDGKEDLHESFINNKTFSEPVNTAFDKPLTTSAYEHHDTVLVVEKEVETIVEQLTPSSLNEVFKPQTVSEIVSAKGNKTLSESIALNDKFIFVRELFGNHFGEYEAGLKQLETFNTFALAENYCKEKLWNKFNWNDKTVAVERFMAALQKKFN